jgi:hypothetical protein
MAIALGKTNHGSTKLYGRAIRAKDVRACGMGAYAFYLSVRFYMTEEFTSVPDDFFCENKNWFDYKLLVDCYANNYCKEMSNDSYAKFMKKILNEQKIPSNHIVHIGRVLGSADLELLENEKSGTLDMGNWASDVHKNSYSIKMPIKSLRKAAGFVLADGMHHNIRTTVEPDTEDGDLLDLVFPFVKRCLEAVLEAKNDGTEQSRSQSHLNTAVCFLELLQHLALVFLQDAAAMVVLHPERGDNAMYKHIPVLKGEQFGRFKEKMRLALAGDECPTDYKLEAVLPGVHQRLQAMDGRMGSMQRAMGAIETSMTAALRDEGQKTRDCLATGLEEAARSFRGGRAVATEQVKRRSGTTMAAGDTGAGGLACTDHQFFASHKSVQSFYNEYYGLGDFEGIPISGGLVAMDDRFGAKWRKSIRGGAKHMSRLKAVMRAIADMSDLEGGSLDRSIDVLEGVFRDKGVDGGKQRLSNLVDILKKQGLVASATSRGPRGRGVGIG